MLKILYTSLPIVQSFFLIHIENCAAFGAFPLILIMTIQWEKFILPLCGAISFKVAALLQQHCVVLGQFHSYKHILFMKDSEAVNY